MKLFSKIAAVIFLATKTFAAPTDSFMISFWCAPPPGGNYDAQYAEIAECNFTHVLPPCSGVSIAENKSILDACGKHGLKAILQDGRLGIARENLAFTTNLDAVIVDYSWHPAFAGYFLSDEPRIENFPNLAAQNQYLQNKDWAHLPFMNLMPDYATDAQLGGTNYEAYVDIFCRDVKPRLLSYDHYALFEKNYLRESYFKNMETIRRAGLKYNIPTAFIFLTTPHGTYRDPTEIDLRWQVNTALAYGCKALLYFTYFTITDPAANFHDGILDPKGNRTAHYDMAKRINAELKILGDTLMQLTSTAVYHTGTIPNGANVLPSDAAIQVDDNAQLVLGFFRHNDGSRWAIIVNRDLQKPISTTLSFDKETKRVKELSPQSGKFSALKLKGQKVRCEFPAGGMKILKLHD